MPLMDYHDRYPELVNRLCKARSFGKDFHSIIFTGDNFEEVLEFALMWMQTCVCANAAVRGDSCGKCENCLLLEKGRYPYLFKLEPASKSRQILIDEIRTLERSLYLTSNGKRKIGLIVEADRMMDQAQNAFLKTLEEPPADTLLLLVTIKEQALLPTIRSRCQIFTLISNKFDYNFAGYKKLFPILRSMDLGKGAQVASSAAQQLLDFLATLQKEAENTMMQRMEEESNIGVSSNNATQKKSESKTSPKSASLYLSYREQLISLIHTWYAQELMRAYGIPINRLPYPQFYDDFPDKQKMKEPVKQHALRNVNLSDELVKNSKFNLGEHLMILDFCHKVCIKNSISC